MKQSLTLILFFLLGTAFLFSQESKCIIKGKITGAESGESLIGADISIKETDKRTFTNVEGNYTLEVDCDKKYTLVISYLGYNTTKIEIEVKKTETIRNVALTEERITTDEITVVGYSSVSKSRSALASKGRYAEKSNIGIKAGTLTAGEIHDFSKWKLWKDIAKKELKDYQNVWGISLKNRYTVQLMSKNGLPIIDAKVLLLNSENNIIWRSRTDNTGKAELWVNVFEGENNKLRRLKANVLYENKTYHINKLKTFHNGINTLSIDVDCAPPNEVDVMFVVDATSSMSDEISYLKVELQDVINSMQKVNKDLKVNLGSVFYRDVGDDYTTKGSDFSDNIKQTVRFIANQSSGGGGDAPEAVDLGLEKAINEMTWSKNAVARLLFLVLDAPPHQNDEVSKRLTKTIKMAAEKGIRIIPITGSGIDKSTEYLMRCLSLSSNGTYVFLTDDSGVGGKHIEPTTDSYKVEFLNDLLVRLYQQYTQMPNCDGVSDFANIQEEEELIEEESTEKPEVDNEQEETWSLKCYPNPTKGQLTIEVDKDIKVLYITDASGKILQRLTNLKKGRKKIDLGDYPSGMYLLRYSDKKSAGSEKIIVIK